MPGDVLGQAINAARAIELLDGLGVDPRQSRQEMIDSLHAAGLNMQPGTVIRGLVDALRPEGERQGQRFIEVDYSQIEMRLAAQFADPVIPGPVPGGRALRYEASTRVRFSASQARRMGSRPHHFSMTVSKDRPMTNPCGEIGLGFGGPGVMDQYVAGDCTMNAKLDNTKVNVKALEELLGLNKPPKPYRSVWWWLRNPIV